VPSCPWLVQLCNVHALAIRAKNWGGLCIVKIGPFCSSPVNTRGKGGPGKDTLECV
jgi:hypothetical protein